MFLFKSCCCSEGKSVCGFAPDQNDTTTVTSSSGTVTTSNMLAAGPPGDITPSVPNMSNHDSSTSNNNQAPMLFNGGNSLSSALSSDLTVLGVSLEQQQEIPKFVKDYLHDVTLRLNSVQKTESTMNSLTPEQEGALQSAQEEKSGLIDLIKLAKQASNDIPVGYKTSSTVVTAQSVTFANGSSYQGQMRNKKKHGEGKYVGSSSHRVYQGQWYDDRCDGKGFLLDGESSYYGFWKEGQKHGLGFEIWHRDGTCYIGHHLKNNKNGPGLYSWGDGTTYSGQFKQDVIQGDGVFFDSEGVYRGQFQNSLQHGEGYYKYHDGTTYNGRFFEGERHGFGRIEWTDGSSYEGGWKQGKQFGKGVETTGGMAGGGGGNSRNVEYGENGMLVR